MSRRGETGAMRREIAARSGTPRLTLWCYIFNEAFSAVGVDAQALADSDQVQLDIVPALHLREDLHSAAQAFGGVGVIEPVNLRLPACNDCSVVVRALHE